MLGKILMAIASFYLFKGVQKVEEKTTIVKDTGVTKEEDVMARTIWGEARGEGQDGMIAVANVIQNRAKKGGWWGATITDVCKKKWQFSCWNADDKNSTMCQNVTVSDAYFRQALEVAKLACRSTIKDITGGATHYHATYIAKPKSWGTGGTITARIGQHIFYKGIA